MKTSRIFTAFVLAIAILVSQVGAVFAAPALQQSAISGTVQELTCEIDPVTGTKTFFVTVEATDGTSQTVHISQITAETLELITVNADGIADCSPEALSLAIGMDVTIAATAIIVDEEPKHPVGDALATFFAETIDEITYDVIMAAHEDGVGFGVIAQALWLTTKLQGDSETFLAILLAKETGIYSEFFTEDTENIPTSWGQFKKALLEKQYNLGVVMSEKDQDTGNTGNNGNNNGNIQGQDTNNSHANNNKNNEKGNNQNHENNGNNGDNRKNDEKGNGKTNSLE